MIKEINKTIAISILSAIIYIIFGIIMILTPNTAIEIVAIALGGILGVIGICSLIKFIIDKTKYNVASFGFSTGIVFLILAFLIIFKYKVLLTIIPLILGVIIIVNGARKTEYILTMKKQMNSNWLIMFGLTIVEIILGAVLVFNPFETSLVFTKIIGIFVIVYSVVELIECVMLKQQVKKAKDIVESIEQ